jgi:hypothetical protein
MQKKSLIIPILSSIFVLIFIYFAYSYVKNLDNCKCVSFLKDNIDNIKNIELFLISIQVIGIVMNIGTYLFGFDIKKFAKTNYKPMMLFLGIYLIVLVTILINFIYNVYEFGTNIPKDCDCADKWQRDILYIQAVIYSFSSLSIVSLLVYGVYVGFRRKMK